MQDEDPKIWGASFWIVMRKVAERYPKHNASQEVRVAAAAWYNAYAELLPCGKCREHYRYLLQKYPVELYLDSTTALCEWVETIKRSVDEKKREQRPEMSAGQEAMIRLNAQRAKAQRPAMARRAPAQVRRVQSSVPVGSAVVPQIVPRIAVPTPARGVAPSHPGRPGCRTCAGKRRG